MYTYMYEYTSVYVCTPFTQNCEKLFGTSSWKLHIQGRVFSWVLSFGCLTDLL